MPVNHLQLQNYWRNALKNEQINNIMSFSASSYTKQDTNKNQIGKNIWN